MYVKWSKLRLESENSPGNCMNNGQLRHEQLLGRFYSRSSVCKGPVTVGVFARGKLTPSTVALELHTANVRVGCCDWRVNVSEF